MKLTRQPLAKGIIHIVTKESHVVVPATVECAFNGGWLNLLFIAEQILDCKIFTIAKAFSCILPRFDYLPNTTSWFWMHGSFVIVVTIFCWIEHARIDLKLSFHNRESFRVDLPCGTLFSKSTSVNSTMYKPWALFLIFLHFLSPSIHNHQISALTASTIGGLPLWFSVTRVNDDTSVAIISSLIRIWLAGEVNCLNRERRKMLRSRLAWNRAACEFAHIYWGFDMFCKEASYCFPHVKNNHSIMVVFGHFQTNWILTVNAARPVRLNRPRLAIESKNLYTNPLRIPQFVLSSWMSCDGC